MPCFCLRIENRAHKTYIFADGMSWVLLGWGGVGVLTFCLVRTVNVATLPRSLECLLHCYAAEISGMLSTLLVATLPRSLECSLRYMLLRCRDLWNACYVTCCYAAEISGMLATLLRCRDLMLYAKMWQWRFVNKYKKLLQKTADMLQKLE